jgi:hypothetical protein
MKAGKRSGLILLVLAIGVLGAVVSSFAHHGTAVTYDQGTFITVTGIVTEFRWRNPHSSLHLDITDDNGKVINYTIEMASPGLMVRQGFNRNRFKVGDKVVFKVHPSKTGAPVGECLFNCDVTINGVKPTPPAANTTP